MYIGHLYVLLGKVSFQVPCPFLIGLAIIIIFGAEFICSLYILNINP